MFLKEATMLVKVKEFEGDIKGRVRQFNIYTHDCLEFETSDSNYRVMEFATVLVSSLVYNLIASRTLTFTDTSVLVRTWSSRFIYLRDCLAMSVSY